MSFSFVVANCAIYFFWLVVMIVAFSNNHFSIAIDSVTMAIVVAKYFL